MKYLYLLLLFFPITALDDSLTVTFGSQTIATIHRDDYHHPLLGDSVINNEKYLQLVEKVEKQVYQEPVNAHMNDHGGIEPEVIGYRLNRQAFKEAFSRYFFSHVGTELKVPLQRIHPKVDTELLATIRTKQIGQYVTYFNTYNKERAHNITLASKAIDNYVLFPGEVFSFNNVVGKRTVERGYLPAPIIVKGELAEGIGGGICQVSSTLYNAVDHAGLKILERNTHSRRVPYVPPGRDATVSWYGPDFLFKNQHNQPVFIRSKTFHGRVSVFVYSSETINYEPRTVPGAPKRLPKEIQIIEGATSH